jgi:FdhD protein
MTTTPLPLAITGGRVPTFTATVYEPRNGALVGRADRLAVEEPLEIRLQVRDGDASTISITMRTPGHDFELVAGFLLTEGIVESLDDIQKIAYCLDDSLDAEQRYNVVTAELRKEPGRASIERMVMTSSACGVCGSASIDAVRLAGHPVLGEGPILDVDVLRQFPDLLNAGQRAFASTGGVHGIALISTEGEVLALREDVGRHNAVDKVLGWALMAGKVPLSETCLFVSGRVSFEIVQKAVRAGIPIVAAVSAATSLAAKLAADRNLTLVGFLRGDRCTVYAGRERIAFHPAEVGDRP